jgi:phage gp36-like protein
VATYASKADIDDLYGTALLVRIADEDRDGVADQEKVDKGLSAADAIIDAYLSAQYPLPLSTVPEVLKTCAIDIAVYKIPITRAPRTEEMRLRYEDALKLLERISTGKVGLGLPTTDEDGNGTPETNPNARSKARIINVGRA